jgi:hypothetical protein
MFWRLHIILPNFNSIIEASSFDLSQASDTSDYFLLLMLNTQLNVKIILNLWALGIAGIFSLAWAWSSLSSKVLIGNAPSYTIFSVSGRKKSFHLFNSWYIWENIRLKSSIEDYTGNIRELDISIAWLLVWNWGDVSWQWQKHQSRDSWLHYFHNNSPILLPVRKGVVP